MKKRFSVLLLALLLLFCSCGDTVSPPVESSATTQSPISGSFSTSDEPHTEQTTAAPQVPDSDCPHADDDANGICDLCDCSVIVNLDFYAINDLHGKICDSNSQPGLEELTSYFNAVSASDENSVLISSGDMWQGSSESNLTKGMLMTDWMNAMGFVSMTIGNHEFDWGEASIQFNSELADFPFLAINIFDRTTDERVPYCAPSVMIERSGIQIGIIGAIGDCYSSISGEQVQDLYFKTGTELTALVKAESERLRAAGADFIIYSLHDGYGQSQSGTHSVTASQLSSYYDLSLSNGYVDLVLEGHTHQNYVLMDAYGVYHLQGGGENRGISHIDVNINFVTDQAEIVTAEYLSNSVYSAFPEDPLIAELLLKYEEQIAPSREVLGNNAQYRNSTELKQEIARLYYEFGMKQWGDQYEIVLGGGFISVRNPYALNAGDVTYSMLQSLFPFDNRLALCSVRGEDLKNHFFENTNSNYYLFYETYGEEIRKNLIADEIYYIIVDTYTASYAPNRLTVVELYDEEYYARDLLAEYIRQGGFDHTETLLTDITAATGSFFRSDRRRDGIYAQVVSKTDLTEAFEYSIILPHHHDDTVLYKCSVLPSVFGGNRKENTRKTSPAPITMTKSPSHASSAIALAVRSKEPQ